MSSALVGLVGVIAGVLATSGLDAWRTASALALRGRVAARLLHVVCSEAALTLELLSDGVFEEHGAMARYVEEWRQRREEVAHVMPVHEFESVAHFFMAVDRIAAFAETLTPHAREHGAEPDLAQLLRSAELSRETAQFYLAIASRTRWQRRRWAKEGISISPELAAVIAGRDGAQHEAL